MEPTQYIDSQQDVFVELSNQIWQFAELGYQEVRSAKLLADALQTAGFAVERGIADIPTAFVARYGHDKPVIAILGEYDALPGLSQAVASHQQPIQAGGSGQACGHNLLGVGSLAAAMAVQEAIAAGDTKGTICYYGCPAEENGSGKAFMVKAGVFDDVDLCLTWHPGTFNGIASSMTSANYKVKFRFYGRASHAAADPHNGRSALDAVELMNVGINYLREHIITDARIHYVITNGGGLAPNIVPAYAESFYLIRAPRSDQLKAIYERVIDVARGAAQMTGTEVEIAFHAGASNLVLNDTIAGVMYAKLNAVSLPVFGDEERVFAREIAETFPKETGRIERMVNRYGPEVIPLLDGIAESLLFEGVLPVDKQVVHTPGSTDVGDVSWVVPTGQITTACHAFGTPGHSWQIVAQSGMSIGHKGMLYAAKVLALSALVFIRQPDLLRQAQIEFAARVKDTPFVSPIPEGAKPPIT